MYFSPYAESMQMPADRKYPTAPDWQQRRRDLAWLIWDLRERRREAVASQERKFGIVRDAAVEGEARFSRLIALVQEINA